MVNSMKKQLLNIIVISLLFGVALQGLIVKGVLADFTSPQEKMVRSSDVLLNVYINILMRLAHKPSLAAGVICGDELV